MMDHFARRLDARALYRKLTRLASSRRADRQRRQARRQARPGAEVLDSRLLMATTNVAPAEPAESSALAERVAQALQPYFAEKQFPGISVTLVQDGQVVLAQGLGKSDVNTGAYAQADTRFDIGSVTKTFTALGVLLLYQESQGTLHPLDLNAPISDYLHNDGSFKLPPEWSQVTTMELLDMESGIRDVGGAQPWQAELRAIARDPLLFTPGTESSYSDANYDLLGELITQLSGESYATFVQNQILGPLGMTETQVLGRSAHVPDQAVGYDEPSGKGWRKAEVQNGLAMYASAGMVSTAQDMGTYMTALLSERILDPATYALMWSSTPTLQYGASPATDALRGLGWDSVIDSSSGPTEVAKNGQVPGFNSELILYPGSDSGVFVSFNAKYDGSRAAEEVTAGEVAETVYAAMQNGAITDE
jgi:D-alanyl-D-alanine carboxypeptidase